MWREFLTIMGIIYACSFALALVYLLIGALAGKVHVE